MKFENLQPHKQKRPLSPGKDTCPNKESRRVDKFESQHLSGAGSSPAGSISRDLNSQKLDY